MQNDKAKFKKIVFFNFVVVILIFSGCAGQLQRPTEVCPGAESAIDSLSLLNLRLEDAVAVKANGQCRLKYYAEGKIHKENFPVKVWVNPPTEIYVQGDVAFDPRGIVLGSNEREFWLAVRLKEVSSYWWGRWRESGCADKLMISPKAMLEAFGTAEVGGEEDWSLSNEDGFDVLARYDEKGVVEKKIYISACDYRVRRIEYFDINGKAVVVTELDRYKRISKVFSVPGVIKIVRRAGEDAADSVSVTVSLRSVRSVDLAEKVQRRLFRRPELKGFKHVYKISEDCDVIEQEF